jgi:hypothetical protein
MRKQQEEVKNIRKQQEEERAGKSQKKRLFLGLY